MRSNGRWNVSFSFKGGFESPLRVLKTEIVGICTENFKQISFFEINRRRFLEEEFVVLDFNIEWDQ